LQVNSVFIDTEALSVPTETFSQFPMLALTITDQPAHQNAIPLITMIETDIVPQPFEH
jgi:hypothetical protein